MAEHIYRFTVKSKDSASNQFRNVFHFRASDSEGVPQVDDFGEMWSDYAASLKTMLPSSITLWGWEAHELDAQGHWQPIAKGAEDIVGLRSASTLPYQVAAVALGYTARGKTIGKKFIGPLAVADVSGGNLVSAFITLISAFCTFWTSTYASTNGQYHPITWSKLKGAHDIITGVCDTLVGTQRRRKPGIGQ